MSKICFITSLVITNNYEPDIPGFISKIDNCDYKLFTNDKKSISEKTNWEICEINSNEISDSKNPVILSRIVKFQPWRINELTKYDILIYCDAYWTPTNDKYLWNRIFIELLNSNSGILQSFNPYRNCAYQESIELIKEKKHSVDCGRKTIDLLEKYQLPFNFGLWRNTFLIYLAKSNKVKKLFDTLWEFYEKNNYTHRDQPLYSLAVFLTNIIPDEISLKKMDHILFMMNGKRGGINGKHIYI